MTTKTLEPVLKRRYRALTADEKRLRRSLRSLYKGHAATVAAIVTATYDAATINGATSHANLQRRIDWMDAIRLTWKARRIFQSVGDKTAYPFNVMPFDRLSKLDAVRAELALSEYELAQDEYALIMAHLKQNAEETWIAIEEWFDYLHLAAYTAANITAILDNKQYPIKTTLQKDHRQLADKTTKRLQEAIVRGDTAKKAARDIAEYVTGREQHNSDGVIYYEGTRVVTESVKEALGENAKEYRSMTVRDGNACELCVAIEAEQSVNPVPVADFIPGITAPPFHPYCRCYIEVVNHDENTENEG